MTSEGSFHGDTSGGNIFPTCQLSFTATPPRPPPIFPSDCQIGYIFGLTVNKLVVHLTTSPALIEIHVKVVSFKKKKLNGVWRKRRSELHCVVGSPSCDRKALLHSIFYSNSKIMCTRRQAQDAKQALCCLGFELWKIIQASTPAWHNKRLSLKKNLLWEVYRTA